MAQLAETSTEAFADFYYDVCCLDYAKMSRAMDPLAELIERTDRVQIKGPGTDLSFSITGLPAVKCDGDRNIPDGEVYTAPVRDSMNGVIQYNADTRPRRRALQERALRGAATAASSTRPATATSPS